MADDQDYQEYQEYLDYQDFQNYIGANTFTPSNSPDARNEAGLSAIQVEPGRSALYGVRDIPKSLIGAVQAPFDIGEDFYRATTQQNPEALVEASKKIGGVASGIAGAGVGASAGAGIGAFGGPFAPITVPVGAILGGAAGGAAGLMGWDMGLEAFGEKPQTTDEEKLNQFIYNTTQGGVIGGGTVGALKGIRKGIDVTSPARAAGRKMIEAAEDTNLQNKLEDIIVQPLDDLDALKSTAERTGNIGLARLERSAARDGGPAGTKALSRAQERNLTRQQMMQEMAPEGASPQVLTDIATQKLQGAREGLTGAEQSAQSQLAKVLENADSSITNQLDDLGPGISSSQAGEIMVDIASRAKQAAFNRSKSDYAKVADKAKIPLDVVEQNMNSFLEEYYPAKEVIPADVNFTLKQISNPEAPIRTLGEARALRSRYLKVAKTVTDPVHKKFYTRLANELQDAIVEAANDPLNSSLTPDDLDAWQSANANYREYKTTYEQQALGKILKKDVYGNKALRSSQVPSRILSDADTVAQFRKGVGDAPEGIQAIEQSLVNDLRKNSIDENGKFNAKRFHSWKRRNAEVLEALPEFGEKLNRISNAQKLAQGEIDSVTQTGKGSVDYAKATLKDIENSALGKFVKFADEPQKAVDAIMNGQDAVGQLRDLKTRIGDNPEALSGLKRSVLDWVVRKTSTSDSSDFARTTNAKMNSVVREKINALKEVFPADHAKRIEKIAEDLSSEQWVQKQRQMSGSDTLENASVAQYIATKGISRLFNKIPFLSDIIGKAGTMRSNSIQNWIMKAAQKPEIALELVKKANGSSVAKVQKTILKQILEDYQNPKLLGEGGFGPESLGSVAAFGANQMNEKSATPVSRPLPIPTQSASISPMGQAYRQSPVVASPTSTVSPEVTKRFPEHIKRIMVESGGNPNAVSPKGAMGLMQLMPGTAKEMFQRFGKDLGFSKFEPLNQEQNVALGEKYLEVLEQDFGFTNSAARDAAYNFGPNAVIQLAQKLGVDKNNFSALVPYLPKETQGYTRKLMG